MSGPSTRSHHSSVRGLETTLAELTELLKANKTVVMITGAGLSAASGECGTSPRYCCCMPAVLFAQNHGEEIDIICMYIKS